MVSTRQLRAAELGRNAIAGRVAKGLLIDQGRGVYAVGYERRDDIARAWRAVLMYPRAALSHRSGAWAHGLRYQLGGPIQLSSMTNRRSTAGVEVHRMRELEVDLQRGLPCTTLAQTFLDCATILKPQDIDAMLHRAEELRTFDLTPLIPLLSDHRGSPALRTALALHRANLAYTRSELERRFVALVNDAGLPKPEYNVFVEGFWVDAYWPRHRLVVELDGGTHRTASKQDSDTRRNATLAALGYVGPIRFTWFQVTQDPTYVVSTLRALLSAPAAAAPHRG